MSRIKNVIGRRVWDSRGWPTVEVEVHLENGLLVAAWHRPGPHAGCTKRWNCAMAAVFFPAKMCKSAA